MPIPSIPLSAIVGVSTVISQPAVSPSVFNVGLIIGPTRIVGQNGQPLALTGYSSTSGMIAAGYGASTPELQAASLYFGQSPAPSLVLVGLQDATAVQTQTLNAGGTGYAVGDLLTLSQNGASGCVLSVSTIGANGAVTGFTQLTQGSGYSVATAVPATGGKGTGFTANITAIGQTALQAVQYARSQSTAWFNCMVCGAAKADHAAIMAFIEGASPASFYFAATGDIDNTYNPPVPTSLASISFTNAYTRSLVIYSTTQGGLNPSNAFAAAAVMGAANGLMTLTPGSFFTLANRTIAGVAAEPVSVSQLNALQALNVNVQVLTANGQALVFLDGSTPGSGYYDLTAFASAFSSAVQVACFNRLRSFPAIAQTDQSQQSLLQAASQVADQFVDIGWIQPGTYRGQQVLVLAGGTALPSGYYIQSDTYADQTAADRSARKAMPIVSTVLLGGAIQSLTIVNNLQQ